jgi:hypothetical protein
VDCEPEVKIASATEFYLVSPKKSNNAIYGIVTNGVLDFAVYNEPITHPQTGCPGRWMFEQLWAHFQAMSTPITEIGGNWSSTSTHLLKANQETTGGAKTLEDAAKLTNTGLHADAVGYKKVRVLYPDPANPSGVGTKGTPGNYTSVNVRFTM